MAEFDTRESIFEMANPAPRDTREFALHASLRKTWSSLGMGALYGIKFYTAQEEAKLRNPDYKGDPSKMNPRWVGEGPVTAMVTVSDEGIKPGAQYHEVKALLQGSTPEVEVNLVPWNIQPPENHVVRTELQQ